MRAIIVITIFVISSISVIGQELIDIAQSQGINVFQSAPDHLGNGMSFYDFNEDGWDDLTFPMHNDSIAFFQNDLGNYTQIGSYLYAPGNVRQILWVDYDNDSDLDLCISYDDIGVRLYQNDGGFNFSDVSVAAGIDIIPFKAYGISFADPDRDSDLDLYVCSYESPGFVTSPTPNRYYENQGNGTFIEMATSYGIDNGLKTTFMSVWYDYNNDNEIDLHLINDRFPFLDALYENQGNGTYNDVASAVGISNDGHFPMTISVSDYNNDGFQDVFVTDVADGSLQAGAYLEYKFFENQSGVSFNNIANQMNLDTNIYAWGALWVDYDNDCYEDLYIATGYTDSISNPNRESFLYRNEQGQSFSLINDSISGDIIGTSHCPVKGDINNDGFYDIVVLNDNKRPNVLLNTSNNNNYIKITLEGSISNPMAIGSKIQVYANNTCQTQTVFCGSAFCAQNSQHKIFGTGTDFIVDSIVVTFPSGIVMKEYGIPSFQNITIREKVTLSVDFMPSTNFMAGCPGDIFEFGMGGFYNYNWSNGATDSIINVSNSGTYSFTAESITGDTLYVSTELDLYIEPSIVQQEIVTNPPCGAINSGAVEIIVTPNALVDSIYWSNNMTGPSITGLAAGNYNYTITTIGGCIYSGTSTIVDSPPFNAQFFTSPVTDTTLGGIEVFIWGGTQPFTYILDGDTVTNSISGLDAGTYDLIVVDDNGCTDSSSVVIYDYSTSGINNLNNASDVYYYNGQVHISNFPEALSIEILDMNGKRIRFDESQILHKEDHISIPVDLNSGIYHILLRNEFDLLKKKFVVL
jgi:hypothetical protein